MFLRTNEYTGCDHIVVSHDWLTLYYLMIIFDLTVLPLDLMC